MVRDKSTYGFSKRDAEELVSMIGSTDQSYREGLVRGSVGGAKLFRFTLNEDMGATTSGEAAADILQLDGTDTNTDANVQDTLGIFNTLVDTDPGYCIKQGSLYYIIQAPCSSSTTVSGGVL